MHSLVALSQRLCLPRLRRLAALIVLSSSRALSMQGAQPPSCASDADIVPGFGFALVPKLTLTDATTRVQTYTGDVHLLDASVPKTACGLDHTRLDVIANGKYDQKQKVNATPNITRHYTARVQQIAFLPAEGYFVSAAGQFLSDNSLALYLQQAYTLSVGRRFWNNDVTGEIDVGAAFLGQHFTTADASTGTVAPAFTFIVNYTMPIDSVPNRPRRASPVFEFSTTNVVGLNSNPKQASLHASISIPTFFPPVSLLLGSWMDYISNPPSGFKNHYLTVDLGAAFKLGILAH